MTRQQLLEKYGIPSAAPISRGMEAEVYACGEDNVLKLYRGTANLADLNILKDFYASIQRDKLSYALPEIRVVALEEDFTVSVERRLQGTCMAELLPALALDRLGLEELMQTYLSAAQELALIPMPPDFGRYKLFDPGGISLREDGDWHRFLRRFVDQRLPGVVSYLGQDVVNFPAKMERLFNVLERPYTGVQALIHGDFFPGNLLVDEKRRVTALLDFGLLTMYGDPLFDIATGWVFFDMYDELKVDVRRRFLAMILERLGAGARSRLYFYVLLYSLLSANTYSPHCADGHYRWCAANLNCQEYWESIA